MKKYFFVCHLIWSWRFFMKILMWEGFFFHIGNALLSGIRNSNPNIVEWDFYPSKKLKLLAVLTTCSPGSMLISGEQAFHRFLATHKNITSVILEPENYRLSPAWIWDSTKFFLKLQEESWENYLFKKDLGENFDKDWKSVMMKPRHWRRERIVSCFPVSAYVTRISYKIENVKTWGR